LDRLPDQAFQFTALDIIATLQRSLGSGDWRWLGAAAEAFTPVDFVLDEPRGRDALAALSKRGLLTAGANGFGLSAASVKLCAGYGAPISFGSLHFERPGEKAEHVTLLRGLGGIVLLEFEGLASA